MKRKDVKSGEYKRKLHGSLGLVLLFGKTITILRENIDSLRKKARHNFWNKKKKKGQPAR